MVYSLRRPRSNPSNWKVQQHVLNAPSVEQAKEWVAVINAAVALRTNRCGEVWWGEGARAGHCCGVQLI